MIYTENNYVWLSDDCRKEVEIYVGGKSYTYAQGSLKLSEGLNSSSVLDFGNVEGSSFSFKIMDYENNISNITNSKVEVYVVGTLNGVSSRVKVGTYIAKDVTREKDTSISVVAYDYMSKFDVDVANWWNNLSYPITIRNMIISLCNYLGVSYNMPTSFLNDSYTIPKLPSQASELSARDVLGYFNNVTCSFWRVNRNGALTRYSLENKAIYPSDDLYPSNDLYPSGRVNLEASLSLFEDIQVSEYTSPIVNKVVVRKDNEDVGVIVGTGTNAYTITDNPLWYTDSDSRIRPYVQNFYEQINSISFNPTSLTMKYLPFLEIGDRVGVTTRKGNRAEFYLFTRDVSNFPYGTESIESVSEASLEVHESVNKSLQSLRGITHKITNTVDELTSEIFDEENGLVSRISQTESDIELKVSKDDIISSINLSTEGVKISGDKINIEGSAVFTSLQDNIDEVSGDLDDLTKGLKKGTTVIDGDCISTGTISAEFLDLSGALVVGGSASRPANDGIISCTDSIYTQGGIYVSGEEDHGYGIYVNGSNIVCNTDGCEFRSISTNHIDDRTSGSHDIGGDNPFRSVSAYSFDNASDRRLKTDIKALPSPCEWVYDLKLYSFHYLTDLTTDKISVMANDYVTSDFANYLIRQNDKGYYSIDQSNLIMSMLSVVQEQRKEIEELKERIEILERGVV